MGRDMAENSYRLIGHGVYTIPEAGRLTGVSRRSIRRWALGYQYVRHGEHRQLPPVIRAEFHRAAMPPVLSFLDLQELRFLHAFRTRGVTWYTLRLAHERARQWVGRDHPFATGQFRTDGERILTEVATKSGDPALADMLHGQLWFKRIVERYLSGLEFEKDEAARWFPERSRRVVLDPERSFGQPITVREGVPTLVLAKTYKAENSYSRVARWYEVETASVRAAVEFEARLAA
jgi:uncharacterized protein (DUF433 family)